MATVPQFISFEGGEGAGKSTQIKLASQWLTDRGVEHVLTREPGGSPGAELIRDLLVKGETDRWEAMTEALLMTASRAEHVAKTIKPALAAGKWVLCDRFFDSTIAYQGAARGLGMTAMRDLQSLALGSFEPDATFILDLPVRDGLERARGREDEKITASDMEDRFERMGLPFHLAIHQGFMALAEQEPDRCHVVDATRTIDVIHVDICSRLERYISDR